LHSREKKKGDLEFSFSCCLFPSLFEPLCEFSSHDLTRMKKRERKKETEEDTAFAKRNEIIDIRGAIHHFCDI
jgi:hypothetical protein